MGDPARNEGQGEGERLSIEEIGRRYPDEWVVLVDDDWTEMKVTQGVVFAHSPEKSEALAKMRELRHGALLWTGKIQSPTGWYLTHVPR